LFSRGVFEKRNIILIIILKEKYNSFFNKKNLLYVMILPKIIIKKDKFYSDIEELTDSFLNLCLNVCYGWNQRGYNVRFWKNEFTFKKKKKKKKKKSLWKIII